MRNGSYAFVSLFFAHGLTAALTIYLAVRGGDWLDRKLGTSPFIMLVLVLLVVASNVHLLIKDILAELDREHPSGGQGRRVPTNDVGENSPGRPGGHAKGSPDEGGREGEAEG